MLCERAESAKLNATGPDVRTPVDLLLVAGALQMGVEGGEGAEGAVAEETLVCIAVPGAFGGPGLGDVGGGVSIGAGDESCGVGDDVVAVHADDHAVQLVARESGGTGAGFKVEDQGGRGYECAAAVGAGAVEVFGFVKRGVEV